MKTKGIEYTLNVTGLFGRNRSIKRESFNLSEVPERIDLGEVIKLRDQKIAEIKLKKGTAYVSAIPVEYENMDGVVFKIVTISFGKTLVDGTQVEIA